jgi:dTDP-4-dehydrorhamnose 3,5-epimerase
MKLIETALPGVLIIEPTVFGDARGFFAETYHEQRYREQGLDVTFVQDNQSRSRYGVLRGLHYQLTQPQGKLVRVSAGRVFDVAVDVRCGSAHFGQWVGVELDAESQRQLYIPPGFAHGFCVLSDYADFNYKCTDYYHPQSEQGIIWNDATVAIEWPLPQHDIQVSAKDAALLGLTEQPNFPV